MNLGVADYYREHVYETGLALYCFGTSGNNIVVSSVKLHSQIMSPQRLRLMSSAMSGALRNFEAMSTWN